MRKTVGRFSEPVFTKEDWAICACGKERFLQVREVSAELVELVWRLYEHSMCQTCQLSIAQKLDMCPEHLPFEGGFAACGRSFAHRGKCMPQFTEEEHREHLKMLKEHINAQTETESRETGD